MFSHIYRMDKFYKILLFVSALVTVSRGAAQTEQYITIEGEVPKPLKLTVQGISKFPTAEVQAKDKARHLPSGYP